MTDPTEEIRRDMIESGQPAADLATDPDRKWTTAELLEEFDVQGFAAPFVVVVRKSDGQRGSMEFQHSPRVYFDWKPDGDE
jgi:hypothetical protein